MPSSLPKSIVGIILGLLLAAPAAAQKLSPAAPKGAPAAPIQSDPAALRLLDRIARRYGELAFYADSGKYVQSAVIDKKPMLQSSPVTIRFERPNRFQFAVSNHFTVASDGARLVFGGAGIGGRSFQTTAPDTLTCDRLRKIPVGASDLYTSICSEGMHYKFMADLLLDPDATRTIMSPSGSAIKIGKDVVIEGKTHQTLVLIYPGPDYRFSIDPRTGLLRRIEMVLSKGELELFAPKDQKIESVEAYWDAGGIRTERGASDQFAAPIAAGTTDLGPIDQLTITNPEADDATGALVGTTCRTLSIVPLDAVGKSRKLSMAELTGKVVVLVAWSIECETCPTLLTDIMELKKKTADLKNRVAFVCVNIDREPDQKRNMHAYVDSFLKTRAPEIHNPPGAIAALDPERRVREVLKTSEHHLVVLIDGDGVIQSVRSGLSFDGPETYDREIRVIAGGGSLLPRKARIAEHGERDSAVAPASKP